MRNRRSANHLDAARRRFLLRGLSGAGMLALGPLLSACGDGGSLRPAAAHGAAAPGNLVRLGPLQQPDANGIRLPPGFRSRVLAVAGQRPSDQSDYAWHRFPDGGATFAQTDGGWIYVSNSEATPGGVGALRFSRAGDVVDAYPILTGSVLNCAGGATPWSTWLSCEEYAAGNVFETDPHGNQPALRLPALGTFKHEAAAVDPARQQLYLTEDEVDGGLYRFTPDAYPSLVAGLLEIAAVHGDDPTVPRAVTWHAVPNPNPRTTHTEHGSRLPRRLQGTPTRRQLSGSTAFNGGEGIGYFAGVVYFTSKGDNRVWAYDTQARRLQVIYDAGLFENPLLSGVDNIVISAAGDVVVAEDNGVAAGAEGMQIVAITRKRELVPLLQIEGQAASEIAGTAFSPDGRRLYFSSQRGPMPDSRTQSGGITYEVSGPFFG